MFNGTLVYELASKQGFNNANKLPLVVLRYDPSTKNVALSSAGLFHFAILVPDRYSNTLFLEIIYGQNVVAVAVRFLQIYLSSQNLLIIFPALSTPCLSITITLLR